ncbi:MAG TPA: Hsp20/alpha crystallin family protein [Candidatus Saccharimonadia bacterium]|nr:Hsp20/alpha crystallin family protein [Candidatus Saccharimonadia bacterium]
MANSLITWDPFRELDDMTDHMNRLVSRSLTGVGTGLPAAPATDIYEEGGKLVVETALPNFKDDDVNVQINQDRLEIKAEHRSEDEKKDRNYLRRESTQSSYYRQFMLPSDIDTDSADAKFENGVLCVTFDRKEPPQPKRLQLSSGKKADKSEK